jgi:hypothetical protein
MGGADPSGGWPADMRKAARRWQSGGRARRSESPAGGTPPIRRTCLRAGFGPAGAGGALMPEQQGRI